MLFLRWGLLFVVVVVTAAPVLAQDAAPAVAMQVERDIPFMGNKDTAGGRQSLDVYAPTSGTHHPIMVWVHGGGWRKGDKGQVALKPQAFVTKGYVFVSVNYRLVPQVTYKEQMADLAHALAWVHGHAKQYGGNPDRIFVMGHSAGAQLVALVAADERYLKAAGLPLTALKGIIPLDGAAYDVPQRIEKGVAGDRKAFSEVFGAGPASWKEASATTHVAKGKGIPPYLIIHVADRELSRDQSEHLARLLRAAGVPTHVYAAKGKTHGSLSQDLGQPGDEPTKVVFDFLAGLNK
ncbi:MAG: alpha/beta hydrolase [Gemmataceae bacterium]